MADSNWEKFLKQIYKGFCMTAIVKLKILLSTLEINIEAIENYEGTYMELCNKGISWV